MGLSDIPKAKRSQTSENENDKRVEKRMEWEQGKYWMILLRTDNANGHPKYETKNEDGYTSKKFWKNL
jgi:hypothetical protein